ncbi:flagellar motor switch protein FliM [bacterium]|nr:flagellar motor switch protein FliM [bacterium]
MAEAGIIRRKLAAGRAVSAEGGPGADRGWRIGLARAARDLLKVALDVHALTVERRSLAELAELVPDRALIAVLEGPAEGLGAIVLSQPILSGFIEAQTIGRVRNQETPSRKPTRTDAAMVIGVIDAALAGLEGALAEEADLVWAGGFRYASFLDDPRPLTLLLEDAPLRVLRAQVSLAGGLREGQILLALPAEGRGERPETVPDASLSHDHGPMFSEALADRIHGAQTRVEAVLARLTMPLAQVMGLSEGMILPLPQAALDRISLEGLDGRRVGEGKLGQNRGMRAVRLTDKSSQDGGAGPAVAGSGFSVAGLAPYARPVAAASGDPAGDFPAMDFPAMDFPAMDPQDLSSFLATGTD